MRTAGIVAALVLLSTPVLAQGPGRGPGAGHGPMMRGMMRGGPAMMARNPAEVVLEHREVLELTADQVREIEAIRDRVEAENEPRIQALMDAFGDVVPNELTIEERYELRETMRELQPVREGIRATNRAAGKEIHGLLSDEQERRLMVIMHADRPGRGDRGMRGRRPWGPGGGYRGGPGGG
jgi:hypothetical protein